MRGWDKAQSTAVGHACTHMGSGSMQASRAKITPSRAAHGRDTSCKVAVALFGCWATPRLASPKFSSPWSRQKMSSRVHTSAKSRSGVAQRGRLEGAAAGAGGGKVPARLPPPPSGAAPEAASMLLSGVVVYFSGATWQAVLQHQGSAALALAPERQGVAAARGGCTGLHQGAGPGIGLGSWSLIHTQ